MRKNGCSLASKRVGGPPGLRSAACFPGAETSAGSAMQCVGGCWVGRVAMRAGRQVGVGPGEQMAGWTTSLRAVGSWMWVIQLTCEIINARYDLQSLDRQTGLAAPASCLRRLLPRQSGPWGSLSGGAGSSLFFTPRMPFCSSASHAISISSSESSPRAAMAVDAGGLAGCGAPLSLKKAAVHA